MATSWRLLKTHGIHRLDARGAEQVPMGADFVELDEEEPWLLSPDGGLRGDKARLSRLLVLTTCSEFGQCLKSTGLLIPAPSRPCLDLP